MLIYQSCSGKNWNQFSLSNISVYCRGAELSLIVNGNKKIILLGSFSVLGHFSNYFASFVDSLFYLRHWDFRRFSTVMSLSVRIKLCQKIPLSFRKVWSISESILYSSCIIHLETEPWIDGQLDENFFPSPSWFVSTPMLLNPSFQSLNLVLSHLSLGADLS